MTLRIISLSTSVHMYVRESSDFNLHIIGNVPLKKNTTTLKWTKSTFLRDRIEMYIISSM